MTHHHLTLPQMNYHPTPQSTVFFSVGYRAAEDGLGFLFLFFQSGSVRVYAVQSHQVGLLLAGISKDGGRSIGRSYSRRIRGQFPSVELVTPTGQVVGEFGEDGIIRTLAA